MALEYDKSKVKILVVDDEDSIRQMLSLALKEEGWDVHEAKNGKEAYDSLETLRPHIIVSDINMPEMTGVELLEKVRAEFPKIEFVIMTSHATLDSAVKAVSLGAYDYLNKPFEDISVVPKKIEKVADKILLRQQNQELIKRLKSAGHALKRLLERISPLNSVLEMDKLQEIVVKAFPLLFQDDQVKASWWTKEESEEGKEQWVCKVSLPPQDDWKPVQSPDDIKALYQEPRNLTIQSLRHKEESRDLIAFEAIKPSLGEIFMRQVEMTYDKVHHHMEIASLANKDGLTLLYNHRYFQERLRQEMSQAQRQKSGLSVILMDIDHFKNYNDNNGHPAGDELLRQFAGLLSDQTQKSTPEGAGRRVTDIVARYGGEEFIMILPFTFYDGAMIKAERIRKSVENFGFAHADQQPLGKVSVSIGVSCFPQHAESAEQLIELADKSLYQAKKDGRNRVVGFEELRNSQTNVGTKPSKVESEGQPRVDMPSDEEVVELSSDEDLIAPKEALLEEENEDVVDEASQTVAESEDPPSEASQAEEKPTSDPAQSVSETTKEIDRSELKSAYEESPPSKATAETPRPLVDEEVKEAISEEVPEAESVQEPEAAQEPEVNQQAQDAQAAPEVEAQEAEAQDVQVQGVQEEETIAESKNDEVASLPPPPPSPAPEAEPVQDFLTAYAPESLPDDMKGEVKTDDVAVASEEPSEAPIVLDESAIELEEEAEAEVPSDHVEEVEPIPPADSTDEKTEVISKTEDGEKTEVMAKPEGEEKTEVMAKPAASSSDALPNKTEIIDAEEVTRVKQTLGAILSDEQKAVVSNEPASPSDDEVAQEVRQMADDLKSESPKKLGKPPIHKIDVGSLVNAISSAVDGESEESKAFQQETKGSSE